jgi:adenosylcobinamide kinase/adenosylcobinamide-phosphate guanylyltransferase
MQLFIGGACAGKHERVRERFPDATWCRLVPGEPLDSWRGLARPDTVLVVTGWLPWLEAALRVDADDDVLRLALVEALEALLEAESQDAFRVVLIVAEVGRGIVPMAAEDRRLRDLVGRLGQEAAARAESVWYVRHGLVQRLGVSANAVDCVDGSYTGW